MMDTLKKILGFGPKADLGALIANGALIVDVRSSGEYRGGHVKGSLNIPLDQISSIQKKTKSKEQVIITCCASGMRSATAKAILQSMGYANVYNGGSWQSLSGYGL